MKKIISALYGNFLLATGIGVLFNPFDAFLYFAVSSFIAFMFIGMIVADGNC